ncbi:MAG: hypothetical protein NTV51_14320 [Verrucomicrobia bacterium]|nr:hypothetical protein [Verrucomicrobiota bacterium]
MPSLLDDLQPPGLTPPELSLEDERVRDLMDDLPGNILKGHGRMFSHLRFVRFVDADQGRVWSADVGQEITTAAELAEQAEARRKNLISDGGMFVGLYFTAAGLRKLGCLHLVPAPNEGVSDPFREGQLSRDFGVVGGRAGTLLGDRNKEWSPEYRQELHALLVVSYHPEAAAAAEKFFTDALARPEIELVDARGVATPEERGGRLYDAGGADGGRELEHFGFRDGIAGLRFLPPLPSDVAPGDLFPLRHVLVPLNHPAGQPDRFGSFLVFRKLEQKVDVFQKNLEAVAGKFFGDTSPANVERAGAWLVGRFRDGTPLVTSPDPKGDESDQFSYTHPVNDPGGRLCPYHAHVRKMNPRGDHDEDPQGIDPRDRLPVRRSIPYGQRAFLNDKQRVLAIGQVPEQPVGLLFMAFVSDIEKQFEHILQRWGNQRGFPRPSAPVDALIGRTAAQAVSVSSPPSKDGSGGSVDCLQSVIPRGGSYLFAPPWSFFVDLKAGRLP